MLFDALLGVFMHISGPFSNVAPVNLELCLGSGVRKNNPVSAEDFRESWEPFMITL